MRNKMKWVLSLALLCGTVTPVASMNLDDKVGREEVKKKTWGKKKKSSSKKGGKGTKKGFWQKLFGDS